jgi:phospholipid/cholesterol/gamma-HCH transport system substrate-binding protein
MEIRARYVLIGVFVLAIVAGGAGFIYWLWGVGGFNERATYAVRFTGPVSGLSAGSEVLFNGIAIGEVTGLSLDRAKPSDVIVTIAVDKSAPVRADTRAGMAFSGLTGAGRINLTGGADNAAPPPSGNPATIAADNATLADLTESARGTLGAINQVIADNADPLKNAIASIDTFSAALARNSAKIDTIVNGLAQLTGGGAAATDYALHDLPAPMVAMAKQLPDGQLVVARPTAVVGLATQRILVAGANGDLPAFDEVRWADTLPILIQARTIEAFENAGYVKVVSDAGLAMGDFTLALDLRAFHVTAAPMATAEVVLAVKLLDTDGKVVDGKTFTNREAVARADDASAAVAGLSAAYAKTSADVTSWALAAMTMADVSPAPAPPAKAPAAGPPALGPLDPPLRSANPASPTNH